VYQGIVRKFGIEQIEELNKLSTKDTYPDLTFFLDVDAKVGLVRQANAGGSNRMEMENLSFHEEVRKAYEMLAKKNDHDRWVTIDANQDMEKVEREIWENVKQELGV
jgi:dTMP kinase